ncbi:hypothetical protein DPMN_114562 [Dreissena polymorpha]|uniref:Uncharacterized protein n=1 Tax=Dreissena polymorpha TaxID=45954 RepID=A0A9D4KK93_DREPO|nr:hypothetical protein DPMN_114562 [Dreissena polymorpha]
MWPAKFQTSKHFFANWSGATLSTAPNLARLDSGPSSSWLHFPLRQTLLVLIVDRIAPDQTAQASFEIRWLQIG